MPEKQPLRWFTGKSQILDEFPSDAHVQPIKPYDTPRGMTASAERIDLAKTTGGSGMNTKTTSAWQDAAWRYYDQIGELKFAFNLVGQIVSRVSVFPAYIHDAASIPVNCADISNAIEDALNAIKNAPDNLKEACALAVQASDALLPAGRQSQFLQPLAVNFSVVGESYIVLNPKTGRYQVASPSQVPMASSGRGRQLQLRANGEGSIPLAENNYLARVWRAHPQWSGDPDSTMMGVLDPCEQIIVADQAVRMILRSRMNAGIITGPDGLITADGKSIEEAITEMTIQPVEDETSAFQVTPLVILGGQPEKPVKLEWTDLSRPFDEQILATQDRAFDRVLRGIDIPKDIVSGLAEVRYSNAIIIDDNMYRAHIEPLIMLICDSLTEIYFQPALRKLGVSEELLSKFVFWYNPSNIVTRPDRSSAANEGYDRHILSAEAWREVRGFSDLHAPTPRETIMRMGMEKAPIPPDIAAAMIKEIDPKFFQDATDQGRAEAGLPEDVQSILDGTTLAAEEPTDPSAAPAGPEEVAGPAPQSVPKEYAPDTLLDRLDRGESPSAGTGPLPPRSVG